MPKVHLNNVSHHYVQLDNTKGNSFDLREDLVMIHGLASNLGFWFLNLAPVFSITHRVTLLDLRGHGLSEIASTGYTSRHFSHDIGALLNYLDIEKAHFVGHSLGGQILLDFAAQHPQRVKSLVLTDTRIKQFQRHVRLTDWPNWPNYRTTLFAAGIDLDSTKDDFIFSLFAAMAHLRLRNPEKMHALKAIIPSPFANRGGIRAAKRWLDLLERTTIKEDLQHHNPALLSKLQHLRIPTLALYGAQSPTLPSSTGLVNMWPHTQLEVIPNAGHFFPTTQPERFITPVRDFYNRVHFHNPSFQRSPRGERGFFNYSASTS